jgi:class I fructose-bisphosphate aldolase
MLTAAANKITELLGNKAEYLLNHECKTISKDRIHFPGLIL